MFHDYVNTTYISTENMFFVVQMISSSHKKIATPPPPPHSHLHPPRQKNVQKITNHKIN